ncbi:MAG: cysteine--tRNA ligase [Paracoccaceae bacterium]
MKLKIYNTKSKYKEIFNPIDPSNVRMYVCGPTVYDRAHIGNARPVVVFDVLYRLLRFIYNKKSVTYVRNITDVDDKIINKSFNENKPTNEITLETIKWFNEDNDYLNVIKPTHEPKATQYIPQMISMIETLISKNNAYVLEDKEVLFSVSSFDNYGYLSRQNLKAMNIGNRINIDKRKRNPLDFVLWKPSERNNIGWDSPWGYGRPGWHIECSAMCKELLGECFDIHGGGIDLLFPHHENEVAQSMCANNTKQLANYWIHNGFVNIEGQKMSKSLGNYLTVEDLRKKDIDGAVIRFVLLSTHYRQPLDWTNRKVSEAENILNKWFNIIEKKDVEIHGTPTKKILKALYDDLNLPLVLTEMHNLLKIKDLDGFVNSMVFLGFNNIRAKNIISTNSNLGDHFSHKLINDLISARQTARVNKDYKKSDEIRIRLEKAGVSINDLGKETKWILKPSFNPKKLLEEN